MKYEGEFRNGTAWGFGKQSWEDDAVDGTVFKILGQFARGQLNGDAVRIELKNGELEEMLFSEWKNGESDQKVYVLTPVR